MLTVIPKIRSHHAVIGNYPLINMEECGYVSPKDKALNEGQVYNPKSRIIGGELASVGDFPWHVLMYEYSQGKLYASCEGVLIHKFWVITDRHCVDP